MVKKKNKIGKYFLFTFLAGGLYIFLCLNGLNLIEQYPSEIGGLVLLLISKLASKWFGWNLSFLLKDEGKEEAGKAIIYAQKKGIVEGKKIGKKIAGRLRAKWAREIYRKKTGEGRIKTALVVAETYQVTKKKNHELFGGNNGI